MIKLRSLWGLLQDFRAVKALWDDRGELTPEEKSVKALEIVRRWAEKTSTTLDDLALEHLTGLVPYANPFWSAWEDGNAMLLWDTSIDVLKYTTAKTPTEIDDYLLSYAEYPMVRDIAISALGLIIRGEPLEAACATAMVEADDNDGAFGSSGEFGASGEAGSPMLIVSGISLILQVLKFWRDRKKE